MAFRGFGAAAPAAGGFGGFGAPAQPATGFGASQPSTGFGGFGAAPATGAASPFGAAPAAASPFGGGANSSPAFGTSSTFGASTTSAFGAPAAPATSAFGNTSAGTSVGFGGFGAAPQQQTSAFGAAAAPAASPFGPTPTTAAASPFGGGGGMFGAAAPKPAFGTGGFGSTATTSTFGATSAPGAFGAPTQQTSAFGAPASTGFGSSGFGAQPSTGFGAAPSAFGAPAQQTSAFGSAAASPFGAAPATTSAFGAQPTSAFGGGGGFGAQANSAPQCGTGNPPYVTSSEQESEKGKPATTIHYQSISKMPQYQHKSVEELRWEDYLKRTDPAAAQQQANLVPNTGATASTTTSTGFGGFGAAPTTTTGAFGAKPPLGGGGFGSTTTSAFGAAPGAFGSQQTSAFGSQPAAPSAFGSGGFGSQQPAAGGFGSTATNSMFGNTTTSAFGAQPAQPQTNSAFGGFGATNTNTTTSGFGTASPGGAFGSGGFGSQQPTAGGFGTGTTTTTGAFGGFGQSTTSPAQTTNAFGGSNSAFSFAKPSTPAAGAFGSTAPSTSAFSFSATPSTPATTGGLFGASNTTSGTAGGFGSFGAPKPQTSTFGGFGSTTATPPTTGGFGTPTTGTSMFGGGSTASTTPAPFSFGGSSNTTSGFGSTPGASLFNKPAATGGATQGFGGSLFSTPGGFGAPTQTGGFGQPTAPAAPTTLVAGHDANPYGAGSFGAGLIEQQIKTTLTLPVPNAMPRSKAVDAVEYQRPSSLMRPVATVPTFLSVPKTTVSAPTPARRLLDETASAPAADFSFATTKFKSIATKQLNIDTPPKVRRVPPPTAPHVIPAETEASSTAATVTLSVSLPSKTTLEVQVDALATGADVRALIGEKAGLTGAFDVHFDGAPINASMTAASFAHGSLEVVAAQPFVSFDSFYASATSASTSAFASVAENPLAPTLTKEGYYTMPDLSQLRTMTTKELQNVDNFAVGCKGLGCVQWYGATDVTNLNLDDLVLFSTREVVVYPDEDSKHALGSGLNRPALVELLQVYPPTQDAKREKYIERVIARTETMDATHVDYNPDAGVWKFRVEHFSRYGLDDDESDDEQATATDAAGLQQVATQLQLNPHRLHELSAMYLPSEAEKVVTPVPTLSASRLAVVEPVPATPSAPVPRSLTVYPVVTPSTSTVLGLWNAPLKSLDLGIFLGRSFRASFGPQGDLVTTHAAQRVAIYARTPATGTSLLTAHRSVSRQDPLSYHVTLPADVSGLLSGFTSAATTGHDGLLWGLVAALYGQEHGAPYLAPISNAPLTLNDLPAFDRRHTYLNQWFEKAVTCPTSSSMPSLQNVLSLLCQHRLVDAASMAASLGNFRLATLIAQASTHRDGDFRAALLQQLEAWATNDALQFMEPELAWIYSLLAGSFAVVTQRLSHLDWLQSLAIVFWFAQGPQSLASAVDTFTRAVAAQQCKPPLLHLKSDPIMELLNVAVGAKASLVPLLNVLEADAAWHLYDVLSHLPGQSLRLSPKQAALLTSNYISTLLDAGRVADAIYVGLTIPDAAARKATVLSLLHKAGATDGLLASLHDLVPTEWFHDAMATSAMAIGAHVSAVDHYMRAGNYDHAHRVLLLHVAIPRLFRGETAELGSTLQALEPHQAAIPLWARYGAVVLSYLRLRESPHIATRHVVLSVCRKLKEWQTQPLAHLGHEHALLERAVLANMLTYMTSTAVALEQALDESASGQWLGQLQGYVQADCFGEGFRATSLMHVGASLVE
ncbi:hypothetical protein SDRG_03876 [Saprolegnia diclina VS20]|uniref:Peptidase S59 domain-containing protein n=1 Tax=Saprolegnia diclina (strain VS20) TaxID=1156394 RepID=T0S1L6_SAPDV|nr:hypothetical protein SDRG_03876 [Saprolegnia diclina VS20]EQC38918.1 hypothetical protein SDRG_03876 [Saprolegnia diclina VS20]|eukprot:XP_008607742.1 hypothetical protein SDRG_03876 [Saprolegnia diclina VS20]